MASRSITRGRVKASARKRTSGCSAFSSGITHSQKGKALVWGLSTRKMRTPLSIQKLKTPFRASQSSLPVGRLEVQGINVLILLRRVLRILNRSVGTLLKELRVFRHPRMIRRALKGDIEGNFHFSWRARSTRSGNRPCCRVRDGSRCGLPPPTRSPKGCPRLPVRPRLRCSCPCGSSSRWDETGGR